MVDRKLDIQRMLREMNVKFNRQDTYEVLKQRLQKEHHRLWLQSVAGHGPGSGTIQPQVLKKRKKATLLQDPVVELAESTAKAAAPGKRTGQTPAKAHRKPDPPALRRQPIDKPAPGKPWKAAAPGTEPFNRAKKVFETVLRRARSCCEGCAAPAAEGGGGLAPSYILPLDQGGLHSIKNVVALCPACQSALNADPTPKTIRDLKRKTRHKIYDPLQIVRKKTTRSRRPFSSRRQQTRLGDGESISAFADVQSRRGAAGAGSAGSSDGPAGGVGRPDRGKSRSVGVRKKSGG